MASLARIAGWPSADSRLAVWSSPSMTTSAGRGMRRRMCSRFLWKCASRSPKLSIDDVSRSAARARAGAPWTSSNANSRRRCSRFSSVWSARSRPSGSRAGNAPSTRLRRACEPGSSASSRRRPASSFSCACSRNAWTYAGSTFFSASRRPARSSMVTARGSEPSLCCSIAACTSSWKRRAASRGSCSRATMRCIAWAVAVTVAPLVSAPAAAGSTHPGRRRPSDRKTSSIVDPIPASRRFSLYCANSSASAEFRAATLTSWERTSPRAPPGCCPPPVGIWRRDRRSTSWAKRRSMWTVVLATPDGSSLRSAASPCWARWRLRTGAARSDRTSPRWARFSRNRSLSSSGQNSSMYACNDSRNAASPGFDTRVSSPITYSLRMAW